MRLDEDNSTFERWFWKAHWHDHVTAYCIYFKECWQKAFEHGRTCRDYTAWLLESHDTGTPRYYAMTALQEMVWVDDVDDAVHFARREDAERPAEYGELHDLRIVEHLWPGGLPRKPVLPPDDINDYAGLQRPDSTP